MFRLTLCETLAIGGRTIAETQITLGATEAALVETLGEQAYLWAREPQQRLDLPKALLFRKCDDLSGASRSVTFAMMYWEDL